VGSATADVRSFEPRWLAGVGGLANYTHAIALPKTDQRHRNGGSGPRKRAEALRERGPSLRDRAVQLAREKGVVTTRELQAIGVHRCYLSPMCRDGLLVRVGHGLYRAVSDELEPES
jgi:hypothetical protein